MNHAVGAEFEPNFVLVIDFQASTRCLSRSSCANRRRLDRSSGCTPYHLMPIRCRTAANLLYRPTGLDVLRILLIVAESLTSSAGR
jgi:hypothetical protein